MTRLEILAYAASVVEGGPVKKAEVLAFMQAFLKDALEAKPDPLPPTNLPKLYFAIEKTETGIHVPRDANRSYTTKEGHALVAMLLKALE